jgi:hypothetical protein
MSAIDFPDSPTNGDTYTANGEVYVYSSVDGTWKRRSSSTIAKSVFTAKGDVLAGTSVSSAESINVGTNGQVLTVNSATSTGLQWSNVPTISTLDDVPDVTITSATTDDVLLWNGSAWVNSNKLRILTTFSINAQVASYALVLADANKLVEMNVGSSNNLTIPPNSTAAFPVGAQIHLLQTGAGQTTVVAGSGVTVNGTPGLKLRAQWSYATLIQRSANTWVLIGDLAA